MKILVFGDSIGYGKRGATGGRVRLLRKDIDQRHNLGDSCANLQVYNLCIPGETALRMQNRFEQELVMRIDSSEKNLVILAIGVNDSHKSPRIQGFQTPKYEFQDSIKRMVSIARKNNCILGILGLLPANEDLNSFVNSDILLYDSYLSEIAHQLDCPYLHNFSHMSNEYVSTLGDGIHPDDKGHQEIYYTIKEFINKLLKDTI